MILLIYNQKMCREILLPNLRDSDYAISISGKAYGLRQEMCIRDRYAVLQVSSRFREPSYF